MGIRTRWPAVCAVMLFVCLLSAYVKVPAAEESDFIFPEVTGKPVGAETYEELAKMSRALTQSLSNTVFIQRQIAEEQAAYFRTQLTEDLMAVVRDKQSDEQFGGPLHRAVNVLGTYRAAEAVPALTERLTYLPGPYDIANYTGSDCESYYPCARALANIGQPAIPALVAKVAQPPDQLSTRVALWVIMEVEGKDQAAHRFEMLAKNTSDPQFRERYEAAKQYILSYEPDRTSPYTPPPAKGDQAGSNGTDSGSEK